MVIYIFRGIRGISLCADELWLFIYSELLGALLSVQMSYVICIFRGIRVILPVQMSYGYLYIQRYQGHFSLC